MSLRRLILLTLLGVAALLCLVNGLAIRGLYHWGLDDASEFYVWRDAERVQARYEATGELPRGDGFLGVHADLAAMPAAWGAALQRQGWQEARMSVLELPGETVYALPLRLADGAAPAWVTHRFTDADDAGYAGLSLGELGLLLLAASLPPLLLIAYVLLRAISRPLQRLSAWADALPTTPEPQALPSEPLRLAEFRGLAEGLHQAFARLALANESERRFLQTLSHELRTPLAVMAASLELLRRQAPDQAHGGPLARIARATATLSALAESLLWLWRDGGQEPLRETLSLREALQSLWEELAASGMTLGFRLDNDLTESARVRIAAPLLRIVLGNALRNALSYGAAGPIAARWRDGRFSLSNALAGEPRDCGFGLGLFLIRRIAERQGWACEYSVDDRCFVLSLDMADAGEVTLPLPDDR